MNLTVKGIICQVKSLFAMFLHILLELAAASPRQIPSFTKLNIRASQLYCI